MQRNELEQYRKENLDALIEQSKKGKRPKKRPDTWNELRDRNRRETSDELGIDILDSDSTDNTMAALGVDEVTAR